MKRCQFYLLLFVLWSFFCIFTGTQADFSLTALAMSANTPIAEQAAEEPTTPDTVQHASVLTPDNKAATLPAQQSESTPQRTAAENATPDNAQQETNSVPPDNDTGHNVTDCVAEHAPDNTAEAELRQAESTAQSARADDNTEVTLPAPQPENTPQRTTAENAAPDNAQQTADIAPPDDNAVRSVADHVAGHAQPNKDTTDNATPSTPSAAPQKPTAAVKLFGTVEFRGKLNTVPRWLDALKRNSKSPLFADENVKLSAKHTWKSLKASLARMKPLDQLKAVNSFWNQWPYRTDPEVYGKPDYWATPREFRAKSGDCEDYCIVKYFTLKELGWPPDSMRIVVVMETIRRIGHAILAVYFDGKIYILDILSKNVLQHSVIHNYIPQFSVNENYKWMHLKPNKR